MHVDADVLVVDEVLSVGDEAFQRKCFAKIDEIKAAGDPDQIADLAQVRQEFNETRWVVSNHFRTIATTVAFGLLAWTLVLSGRVGSADGP